MMKKVMTLTGRLIMAATLTMGITACSSSEDAIEQQPQQSAMGTYTMTIKASKGNGNATTRALTLSDKTLTATWATSEHVYVKKGSTWATGSLVPDANDATANLSGELSGVEIAAGDKLTLQFPKTGDISYAGQKGTLSNIAQNYDYAKADITVASVTNGNINVSGTTTFTNQQAIVKFTLIKKSDGTTKLSPTALTVSDGTGDIATLTDVPADTYSDPNNGAGVLYVAIPGFSDKTITLTATVGDEVYIYTKSNTSFSNGQYYEVTVKMKAEPVGSINLAEINSDCEIQNGYRLYGTLSSNVKISIADGATVTFDGVTINGTNNDSYQWAGITCNGDATIILNGENTVNGFQQDYPGISVPVDKTLTINGTGSLNASSYGYGCGIGGRSFTQCGNITINGGTITATGGDGCAGIGGSRDGTCGNINITGGNVTASGGNGAAGIGGGYNDSEGYKSTCGNISIIGGTLIARGGNASAGIGGGYQGDCGNITIANTVTQVTASTTNGSATARCIGKRNDNGTCGTLTIGGTVYWDGSDYLNDGESFIRHNPFTYPQLYTCNGSDWSTQVAAFNNESNANPVLQFTSDISTGVHEFVISRSNGIVDLNRYTLYHINLRNDFVGQSVTIKNGTISGDSYYDNAIDGMGGWVDFFKGTVILENLTVQNGIYTDGHEYIIQSGNYQTIFHGTSNGCPGKLIIHGGYFNKTIQGRLQGSAVVGTYELYGGKYAVRPEDSWCASAYSVKENTDDDRATYPWIVSKD